MLVCILAACIGLMVAPSTAQNISSNISSPTDDVDNHMFQYFFDEQCLQEVTPIQGRDPVEDSKQFFHDHLGDLRVDSTITSMLAFAALMSLTLSAELPEPNSKKRVVVFLVWMACQFVQCVLLVFAIVFTVLAYISLHNHYGTCLLRWKEGSLASLHLLVFLTVGFQPAIVQRLCALLVSLVALTGATKKDTPRLHSVCKVLQYACGFVTLMCLGFSVACWLTTSSFAFSAMFLPCLMAALVCSIPGLVLLHFGEAKAVGWVYRKWAQCRGKRGDELPENEVKDTWMTEDMPNNMKGDAAMKERVSSFCSLGRDAARKFCSKRLFCHLRESSVHTLTAPGPLAYACLFWIAAAPMVIFGTWVAFCLYMGGSAPEIDKSYGYLFEVFLGDFQWPSLIDLRQLKKIPAIADYFADMKDFMGEPPTYLLTGSRVISLFSFLFAILKKGVVMVLAAVDKYTAKHAKTQSIKIGDGQLLISIRELQPGQVLDHKLQACRDKGFTAKRVMSENRHIDAKALNQAGYDVASLKEGGFDSKALRDVGYTGKELKDAGFTFVDLTGAFSDKELYSDLGFGVKDFEICYQKADVVAKLSKAGDYGNAWDFKENGYRVWELKEHYPLGYLRRAGFSPVDLKPHFPTCKDWVEARLGGDDLKMAKFSLTEMVEGEVPAQWLMSMGYNAKQLKSEKVTLDQLVEAGFTGKQLYDADFPESDLREKGFTGEQMYGDILRECFKDATKNASAAEIRKMRDNLNQKLR